MTGEWAQQAADNEGGTVYDADLDLYSGVGGVAGLFDLATIVILPAPVKANVGEQLSGYQVDLAVFC